MDEPISPQESKKKMEEELARLQAKLVDIKDTDIIQSISIRIEDLKLQISRIHVPTVTLDAVETVPDIPQKELTPDESAIVEKLVREARVAHMRGQREEEIKTLKQAQDIAPGSALVLELLADVQAEHGQTVEAIKNYKLAMAIAPNQTGLERKHANLVFQAKVKPQTAAMMLRQSRDEMMANMKEAGLRSALLPGLGQISLGQIGSGIAFMVIWVACTVWFFAELPSLKLFFDASFHHGSSSASYAFALPAILALLVHGTSFVMAKGSSGGTYRPEKPEHPTPPVNLPFQ